MQAAFVKLTTLAVLLWATPLQASEEELELSPIAYWSQAVDEEGLQHSLHRVLLRAGSAVARMEADCLPTDADEAILLARIAQAETANPPWRSRSPFHPPPDLPEPRAVNEAIATSDFSEAFVAALAALDAVDGVAAPWARELIRAIEPDRGPCRPDEVAALANLWRLPVEEIERTPRALEVLARTGRVPRGPGLRVMVRLYVSGAEEAQRVWLRALSAQPHWEDELPWLELLVGERGLDDPLLHERPDATTLFARWARAEALRRAERWRDALSEAVAITEADPLFVGGWLTRASALHLLGRGGALQETAVHLRSLRHQQPGYEIPIERLLEATSINHRR